MNLVVEKLKINDLLFVSQLIERSFNESVAPTLNDEGVETFKSGLAIESLKKRLDSGNLFIICRNDKEIVGVGEIRDKNHLNLFFVEPNLQKKGIGRKIFNKLICHIEANKITVNSSLNAIKAYKQLGFNENGLPDEVNGIKYQPMVYSKSENT